MKRSDYWLLMAAVLTAPHMPLWLALASAGVCLVEAFVCALGCVDER